MKITAIIFIVAGVLALAYQGFSYKQTEKDAKIGPVEIQHQETKHVYLPPVVGGLCLAVGIIVLVYNGHKNDGIY